MSVESAAWGVASLIRAVADAELMWRQRAYPAQAEATELRDLYHGLVAEALGQETADLLVRALVQQAAADRLDSRILHERGDAPWLPNSRPEIADFLIQAGTP